MSLSTDERERIRADQTETNRNAIKLAAIEQAGSRANGHLASQLSQSQPMPLVRSVQPPAPYPIDALGPVLAPAARAIADQVQVPEALAGNSLLAAAALAAQAHANVQTLGGARPLSLYVLTIAESGERKTTADSVAAAPIRDRVATLQTQYRDALRDYDAQAEAHKMRVRQAKDKAETPEALQTSLRDLAEDEPPRKPWMIATEPTPEGLILSLKDGQYAQGIFSDEAGTLIGGHALSDEAELRTIAMLSRAWDGSPLDRVRAKDREHVTLYGRRLSMHLMAQPEVALRMLGKALYRSQGFLARILIAAPVSLIGTRKHQERSCAVQDDPRIRQYGLALANLLGMAAIENRDLGGLDPRCLALSPDARSALITTYDEIEVAQETEGDLSTVREFASKAGEHACRIAGVLALVADPKAFVVGPEEMTGALRLTEFYLGEQLRLAGAASISSEIADAQKLLDWIKRKGHRELTGKQVMQLGPNSIRDGASARRALRMLVDFHWLITEDGHHYCLPPSAQAALLEV
jgi:Protein of unknown function (DUF3987)